MVTLNSADNALKTFYLEAVKDTLDNKSNPFLAKIEKTTKNVSGKSVQLAVKTAYSSGISAGTEEGALPTAGANRYMVFETPLKNLYGTIEISDKAIRASASNEGAFVNLLNDEMDSLVKNASYNFARMLFGNTRGVLTKATAFAGDKVVVENPYVFAEGMSVDVYGPDDEFLDSGKVVQSIDDEEGIISFEGGLGNISDDCTFYLHGSKGNELTGLDSIFEDEILYGVDRSNRIMRPYNLSDVGVIDELLIQEAIDTIEKKSGSKINFIVCSWEVRRALISSLKGNQTTIATMELEGGFKALSFNGIPVVVDRFCPKDTMYLLNTDDFKLCQLCDWQWLEAEDGKILKQVPGKATYTATLVKYAELICERPYGQGRLKGIEIDL
jgi:hypothetical protein